MTRRQSRTEDAQDTNARTKAARNTSVTSRPARAPGADGAGVRRDPDRYTLTCDWSAGSALLSVARSDALQCLLGGTRGAMIGEMRHPAPAFLNIDASGETILLLPANDT